MSNPVDKYIIPKLNSTTTQINTTITDTFCVVGADYSIGTNGSYPILGNTNPLAYSYDGIYYHPISNITLYKISKVDFNGYQWIAGGYNYNGYGPTILTSSDGINWIQAINNIYLTVGCNDVIWGQKKWVAVGIDDGYGKIIYSSDGMNWNRALYNDDGHVNNLLCVAYNGSYFLAGGINYIAKSSDGITWTDVNVQSVLGTVNSITWNGHIWVAAGTNANSIAYSYNGTSWTASTSAQELIHNGGLIVSYNGTLFLAGGNGAYTLISSKDGINWTGVMPSSNETYFPGTITDITWNGTYWFVTNSTNNFTDPKISYSSDLVNWNLCTDANTLFNGIKNVNSITCRNRNNYLTTFC
jgi:hypothetical protein